ncbi:MAG TPA: ATP-binding protein [Marinagarivorans sp.]
MKIKISYKIIGLNLGIIAFLTVLFATFSYTTSRSMYSNALNGLDTEVMALLAQDLGEHYEAHGSWQALVNSPALWGKTVNERFFATFFLRMEEAKSRLSEKEKAQNAVMMPPPPPPGSDWEMPFGTFLQRASLLDADKKVLIAAEMRTEGVQYQKIKSQGKTVGWIEVGLINVDILPLASYFYDQQMAIVYWVIGIGGVLAALVSILLAHHITAPIKKLTLGAQKIAQRQYLDNIEVNTRDELKDLATSFNRVSHELHLFEKRQKQWLMDISHELRTPVAILIAELSAMCDNLTQYDLESVAALKGDVLQIQRLVDDLHELSKLEETGLTFNQQPFDLVEILRLELTHFEAKFKANNINVSVDDAVGELPLLGDCDRIAQVIKNLLENCVRYTEPNGKLWITVAQHPQYGELVIEDSGPGVADESLTHLFDRLYRVESSRNRISGGAGLGLAICKEIITAHGGTITAEHSRYGGLLMRLTFPSARA